MTLVDYGAVLATTPDLIRLLIIPVFAWVAWKDIQTRRVPNIVWLPFLIIGTILFAWEAWVAYGAYHWPFFISSAAVSLFVVIPAAYFLWLVGGFGGADAKAIMTLAVFFPTYPTYYVGMTAYPVVESAVGSFSFTILANAVVLLLLFPVGLILLNTVHGNRSKIMFLGRPMNVEVIPTVPGRLLETQHGFTRKGLDLDVLRMYLNWRGTTLSKIRIDPESFRHPVTVPDAEERNEPTDGRIRTDGEGQREESLEQEDEMVELASEDSPEDVDWWGASEFIDDAEYTYGVSEEGLREGLEVLVRQDTIWVSPGTPFMVPLFFGLVTAIVYGNILFAVLNIAFGL